MKSQANVRRGTSSTPRKLRRQQKSSSSSKLRTVELAITFKGRQFKVLGSLFATTRQHVIVLNNVVEGAELGKLKKRRVEHLNPEADIYIFPRNTIDDVRIFHDSKRQNS